MCDNVQIRHYTPDERPQARSLSKRAMKDAVGTSLQAALDHDMSAIRRMHRRSKSEFLIGIVADELVLMGGFVHREDATVEIQKIRVDPDHQRNGYGQTLLDILEDDAEQRGIQSIVLHTSNHLTAAQQFHQKNDYTETHRKRERGKELIFYEKQL